MRSVVSSAVSTLNKRYRRYGSESHDNTIDLLGDLFEETGSTTGIFIAIPMPERRLARKGTTTRREHHPDEPVGAVVNWDQYRAADSGAIELDRFLSSLPWNRHYPPEQLALTGREQAIYEAHERGDTITTIARDMGLRRGAVAVASRSAYGKIEALDGRHLDIHALSPDAQKVIVLNYLFEDRWHDNENAVVARSLPDFIDSIAYLDSRLGLNWRRYPRACLPTADSLAMRCDTYDKLFGTDWQRVPNILTLQTLTVTSRVKLYDKHFGEQWRKYPRILTNMPRTVLGSSRCLAAIGLTLDTCVPSRYFRLLSTSTTLKRARVTQIRREILQHDQIWESSDTIRLSELVRRRRLQTRAEKARETKELAELRQFVLKTGGVALEQSIKLTSLWAREHGYVHRMSAK